MSYPNALANGAEYLKDSAIISISVLVRVIVPIKTSLTLVKSSTLKPIAVRAFVAISAARPRSKLPAVAKLRVPGKALTDSLALNPAMLKNRKLSAACEADHSVCSPIRRACCSKASNSDAVARLTPLTTAIVCEKLAPVDIILRATRPRPRPINADFIETKLAAMPLMPVPIVVNAAPNRPAANWVLVISARVICRLCFSLSTP